MVSILISPAKAMRLEAVKFETMTRLTATIPRPVSRFAATKLFAVTWRTMFDVPSSMPAAASAPESNACCNLARPHDPGDLDAVTAANQRLRFT